MDVGGITRRPRLSVLNNDGPCRLELKFASEHLEDFKHLLSVHGLMWRNYPVSHGVGGFVGDSVGVHISNIGCRSAQKANRLIVACTLQMSDEAGYGRPRAKAHSLDDHLHSISSRAAIRSLFTLSRKLPMSMGFESMTPSRALAACRTSTHTRR